MRHRVKFCADRSNQCRNIAVFLLGFVWTTHEEYLLVFVIVQNVVGIDAVVSIICKF